MTRKLVALLATVLMTAGFGLASTTAAQAAVIPHHGHYTGHDYDRRAVSFSFNGTQMSHFMVGHQSFGGAHVSNGAWHETCANGYCTKGAWKTDTLVEGFWRHGSGHWTAWSVTIPTASTRYHGTYQGRDVSKNPVHFSYAHHRLTHFTINGHAMFADPTVNAHGVFAETCKGTWCIKGHWADDYTVQGYWRDGSTWHFWEARAYAS